MLGQLVASRLLARSFYSLVALGLVLIFGVIADRRIDGLPAHRIARLGVGRTFQVIRVFAALTAMENLLGVSRGTKERRGGGPRSSSPWFTSTGRRKSRNLSNGP